MAQQPTGPTIVLVVEDDPILMMTLVDYVAAAGCEALEATSVADAIRILEDRSDVRTVFADLDMRGSTAGMKLAAAIRHRWPPIELLLISSQPWHVEQLPERGVLVGKPFDERKIVRAIRHFAA